MALRSDWSGENCSIARGADVFGDPWAILILREIILGNRRFDGLRKKLNVADNVLSSRLQRLTASGLLSKEPYGGGGERPRHEYLLTAAGQDSLPVLNALSAWAARNTPSPSGRVMNVYCKSCQQPSQSADWCTNCKAELTIATTLWERTTAPGILIDLEERLIPVA